MGKRIGRFGLVNYMDHPTEKDYRVFNFNSLKEADLFEEKLKAARVTFERDVEEHEKEPLYLFGVHYRDFAKAQDANFLVAAETRKPLISNLFIRLIFLALVFGMIAFAIVGYMKS